MSAISKFSNTQTMSINELFQLGVPFKVPPFQRNYAWTKEKVETLWNDIIDNFETIENETNITSDAEYLLGPIVLVKTQNKEMLVVDGQQRISTFIILFCVVRDIMKEYGETAAISKIEQLIKKKSIGRDEFLKLELNVIDRELFNRIQNYEYNGEAQYKVLKTKNQNMPTSNKLLSENYRFLYDKSLSFLDESKSEHDSYASTDIDYKNQHRKKHIPRLAQFIEYILEYNYVVVIIVDDDNTAFQIFETLNDRGQTLSKSNLIKNHVMRKIDDKNIKLQLQLSNEWDSIFNSIGKQLDDDFILESLRSRYKNNLSTERSHQPQNSEYIKPIIEKRKLYKEIKKRFISEAKCRQCVKFLGEDVAFISTLNDPVLYSDESTKNDIYSIKLLNATYIRTPILAAYRKWGYGSDYQKLVKLLVKFFFKFKTVMKTHTAKVEKLIVNEITPMINGGESLESIRKKISEYDKHDDFLYNFKRLAINPGDNVAKYVLREITIHLGTKHNDVRPIDSLTLEHILPKHHKEHWKKFMESTGEEKSDEYVDRLGNLTLLHEVINSNIQNKSFLEKRDAEDKSEHHIGYRASGLDINKKTVCNETEWTPEIVKKREEQFCDYANEIWDLEKIF